MAHLGTFGAAQREAAPETEKDTFDFCGEEFVVEGRIPSMLMIQLGAAATEKIEEQEGLAALWEAMRCSLTVPEREVKVDDPAGGEPKLEKVPADASQFNRFYKLAVANCVELEDLMQVAMGLYTAQAGRPTVQRPASPAGALPTSTSSRSSASRHPALEGYTPVDQLLLG